MSRLSDWLDRRLGAAAIRRGILDRKVPDRLTWGAALGSATLAAFLVQLVTGLVLATYYSPSTDHAYDSVQFLQHQVLAGALLRGIHHWGASAVVVLLVAHIVRVFSIGAYKYPREANWMLGVGLFIVIMGFAFTGYLLPWDQRAYWATVIGTSIGGATPLIGGVLQTVLRNGSTVGAATLTRVFALHVLWFPVLLGILVIPHLALVVFHGWSPRPTQLEDGAPTRTDDPSYREYYEAVATAAQRGQARVWPDVVARAAVAAFLVVFVIVCLGAIVGTGLEPPADPTDTAYVPSPEWYFLPLYQLMKLVPGSIESVVSVGVPAALVIVLLTLPFFDRYSRRSLRGRPVAMISVATVLGSAGLLIGVATHESPPAEVLVGAPLTNIQRAGRAMFRSQCTTCHQVAGQGGQIGPDLSEVGLHHSEPWLYSFIEEPSRFHRDTHMLAFAPPRLTPQELEEVAQYVTSLRGKAGPEVQPQFRDTFP